MPAPMNIDYSAEMPVGIEGAKATTLGYHVETVINIQKSVSQVTEGTVVANNGDAVGLVIDGVISSVTSTGSAAGTAALIETAVNANAFVNSKVEASVDGIKIVLTFLDDLPHTVTSYTPATADITPITTITAAAQVENMAFGRVVVHSSEDVGTLGMPMPVKLPSGAGGKFAGFIMRSHSTTSVDPAFDGVVPSGEPCNSMLTGDIWVRPETSVSRGGKVYFRHTANGPLKDRGRVRGDADGGNADLLSSAEFFQDADADELVRVVVNAP